MELYEIAQSEKGVGKAFSTFLERLSEHVTLLARNGKPITSLMGIKRDLYRYKKQLLPDEDIDSVTVESKSVDEPIILDDAMTLLVGDVLDRFGVDVLDAVKVGLIGERELKRVLIGYDYERMAMEGLKYKDIKAYLSDRYGWSVSSIEKLVYGKGKR